MQNNNGINLYDRNGQRKYMTSEERRKFYELAKSRELPKQLFLLMLFHSGARISEVLNLHASQIDSVVNMVIIECLKKRKKGIYRAVPLPRSYILALVRHIKSIGADGLIWPYSRRSALRYVKAVTNEARINGVQACAKGLRHSFAVSAIEKDIPLNLIKNWMGHSSITTTEIYLNVSGQEERRFAERMW